MIRYLALGDSYTIGEGVPPAERWPAQLAARLRADGLAVAEPVLIARTGWTTDELSAALDAAPAAGPCDLVSLLIGVNDQYRGRDRESYRAEFTALLERAVALAGGRPARVLALSIPDWGVTPFAAARNPAAIAAAIDAFNAINRAVAAARGARYVDITRLSRQVALGPAALTADGLHFTGRVYAAWAELARPAARAALEGP